MAKVSARVEIPYKPRHPEVHQRIEKARVCVIVAHRRFGKTVLAINHLIKMALLCPTPAGLFAYVAPLRNQAERNVWDYLKHYTSPIPGLEINEARLEARLPSRGGWSKIRLHGADNPDSLRGSYLDGVVMDEVAQMKPEVWHEVVQPMLLDHEGFALFIGTPKGVNLFSELYHKALARQAEGSASWAAMRFPATETGVIPAAKIEELRAEMSDSAFRQEMLCDFSASGDDILISLDEAQAAFERSVHPEVYMQWPLVLGVDVARFGDDATVFFPRRGPQALQPLVLRKHSNTGIARILVAWINERKPFQVNIDQGQGTGVIDLVRDLTRSKAVVIHEVPFGARACDPSRFANIRAEIWTRTRDWLRSGGCLPNGGHQQALLADLTAPTYSFDLNGRIRLEPKEKIKERLERSPDLADALALTFAVDIGPETADFMAPLAAKWRGESHDAVMNLITGKKKEELYDPFAGH